MASEIKIEENEEMTDAKSIKSYLEKSSKRAAFMSLAGVLIVVAALIFSFFYLNKQLTESQRLSEEIETKKTLIANVDTQLKEKQIELDTTSKAFIDYRTAVKEESPQVANTALKQTIAKNPNAKEIIQELKTPITPKSDKPSASTTPREADIVRIPRLGADDIILFRRLIEKYDKLKTGMSYGQVVKIIGGEGTIVAKPAIGLRYRWEGENYEIIDAIFDKDQKLVNKIRLQ